MALKRTLGELGSIGRNLNQIAHAANQGQLVTSPGRDDLEAMLRVCGALRDNLKRVLRGESQVPGNRALPSRPLGGSNRPTPVGRSAKPRTTKQQFVSCGKITHVAELRDISVARQ